MTINDPILCKSNIKIIQASRQLERAVREGELMKLGRLYATITAAAREAEWEVNDLLRK